MAEFVDEGEDIKGEDGAIVAIAGIEDIDEEEVVVDIEAVEDKDVDVVEVNPRKTFAMSEEEDVG